MKDLIKFIADYIDTETERADTYNTNDLRRWIAEAFDTYQDQNDIKCNLVAAPDLLTALHWICCKTEKQHIRDACEKAIAAAETE